MTYELEPINAPRAAGHLLRALAKVLESPISGDLVARQLLSNVGIDKLRDSPLDEPLPSKILPKGSETKTSSPQAPMESIPDGPELPRDGFPQVTAAQLIKAYGEGRATPTDVARKILAFTGETERMKPAMRVFIAQDERDVLEQADASTRRWARGESLGPLDGVPIAIKDELDQLGYPTTVGTAFLGEHPARADAEVVARLRRVGAVLIGKTNMQEIGLGVIGHNPHWKPARNPWDPDRACGGSSSGSAAAVAMGLCPIAIGADGGGSIRIPAALCGQIGLKPTFGRVSEQGAAPLCWSVAHVGPIAATVRDAALAYAMIAGPDPADHNTLGQPSPHLDGVFDIEGTSPLEGVRLGLFESWFQHADYGIVSACSTLIEELEKAGATVVKVDLEELQLLRAAHLVTIVSEMVASQFRHFEEHLEKYSIETRCNLALGRRIESSDYVHAQRYRARFRAQFARVFENVDVLVTPATGTTAPRLQRDALDTGESNLELTDRIMRFAPAANLLGLPALAMPAGYDRRGLPVSLQVMGRPFEEHLLLKLASFAETLVERRKPTLLCDLLNG